MNHAILILVGLFIATNIAVEAYNVKAVNPLTSPISSYLAGVPFAWVQDAGFGCMAVALLLLGITHLPLAGILFLIAAAALPVVVWTKYRVVGGQPVFERYHVIAAGIAYVAITAALLVTTYRIGGLAFGAALAVPCIAFLFMRFRPDLTALEEKFCTVALMVSLIAWLK